MSTKITEIQLIPIKAKNGLTFFASCVWDGKLFLGNIAVFTRRDGSGFRCVYPTKMLRNNEQIPIYYPLDQDTGNLIEKTISLEAQKLLLPEDPTINNEDYPKKGGDEK